MEFCKFLIISFFLIPFSHSRVERLDFSKDDVVGPHTMPIPADSGLYLEEMGQALITTDSWTLLAFRNINWYERQKDHVIDMLVKVSDLCSEVAKKTEELKCNTEHTLATDAILRLNKKFNTILHLMGHGEFKISDLKNSTNNRRKRFLDNGLAPGLSTVWKWITGAPDNEDKLKYDKYILQAIEDPENAKNRLENQYQIFKNSINSLQMFQVEVIRLDNYIKYSLKDLKDYLNQTQEQIRINALRIKLNENEEFLDQQMNGILEEYDEMINAILFAGQNMLHPYIITPSDLYEELHRAKIPNDLTFPFERTVENMFQYLKICKIDIYMTKKRLLTFTISIPLTQKSPFSLYQVHPIPIPIFNMSNAYYYLNLEVQFYMINAMRTQAAGLMNLSPCTILKQNTYICAQDHFKQKMRNKDCIFNVLTSSSTALPKMCPLKTMYANIQSYNKLSGNRWLFYTTSQVNVELICEDYPSITDFILEGAGILMLPPKCKAVTAEDIMESSQVQGEMMIDLTPTFPNLSLPTDIIEYNTLKLNFRPPQISNLHNLHFKAMHEELDALRKNLDEREKQQNLLESTNYLTWAIRGIVALIIIFVIVKMRKCFFECVSFCHTRHHPHVHRSLSLVFNPPPPNLRPPEYTPRHENQNNVNNENGNVEQEDIYSNPEENESTL